MAAAGRLLRVGIAALLLVVAFVVARTGEGEARGVARAEGVDIFLGRATWIDIYDVSLYRQPERTAARIAARGVKTVFAETANDRSTVDVVEPAALGRLVDALHQRGVAVAAWYLPGFVAPGVDLRRARAMLSFSTPGGGRFDAVALDIESLRLKNTTRRSARLISLLTKLKSEAGERPVGAIVYPHRALERHPGWWPDFPWSEVGALADAVVPMAYTGGGFRGYDATYGYVTRSLRLLRRAVGDQEPLHIAGGVANRMNAEELQAFVDATDDTTPEAGISLYDFETTTAAGWDALARALPSSP